MKKLLTFLGLVVGAGGLVLATASNHKAKESKAVDYETYIPMEASFFANWTDDAGGFGDENATFWGENYHFQAMDTFYRGELKEGWTGTLTTRTWKQHTQYIYFQFGGAKNYDVTGDPVHLKIHYGDQFDVFYNDTFVENPMLLRGYKIPDAAYNSLMENADDFDMYIEIIDYQSADYGFANFGYLHVNQTKEEVGDAMRYYLNKMNLDDREWEVNKRKQILENYYLNNSLKEFFLDPIDSIDAINDGFDYVGEFLNHWYFDYHYFNGANWNLHFNKAIGYDTHRPEETTNMPFNNNGVGGFFRGWYENDELGGFVSGDASIYRFISRPFVLSGTGIISIKMAGTASLHVIDAETRQDLVWADLLTFSTDGDQVNLANSNFNTVTMVRHHINLEAYLGRTIQLAIADVSDGGWSALYVDELRTNVLSYTSFGVDTFEQTNSSGTFYGYKIDKYINSTCYNAETNPTGLKYVLESEINKANDNAIINHVDDSPAKKAYDFLEQYYSSLRSPTNEFDYSKASEETKANVVSAYNSLTSYVQGIVNWSYDIVYPTTFEQEWWNNKIDNSNLIKDSFESLVNAYTMYTISFDANGGSGSMSSLQKEDGSEYILPDCTFEAPQGKEFDCWVANNKEYQPGESIIINGDVVVTAQWKDIPNALTGTIVISGVGMYDETLSASLVDTNNTGVLSYKWKRNGVAIEFAISNVYHIVLEDIGNELSVEVTSSVEQGTLSASIGLVTKRNNNTEPTGLTTTACTNENNNDGTIMGVTSEMEYSPSSNFEWQPCQGTVISGLVPGEYYVRYAETVTHDAGPLAVVTVGEYVAPQKYEVTVNGGKANVTSAAAGEVVTITANAPESGYEFDKWISDDVEFADENSSRTTFVMPEKAVEIRASYKALPPLVCVVSFDANGGEGTMESVEINKGAQYVIPACTFTAPEGKQFDSWLIGSVKYQPGEKITIVGDTLIKASWVNADVEPIVDPEEPEKEEEEAPKGFLEKMLEVVQNLFQKLVDLFKNLFAGSSK